MTNLKEDLLKSVETKGNYYFAEVTIKKSTKRNLTKKFIADSKEEVVNLILAYFLEEGKIEEEQFFENYTPDFQKVKSSIIDSIAYIDEIGALAIKYPTAIYFYKDTPYDIYIKMLESESKQKFFLANIKDKYPHSYKIKISKK